MPLNRVRCHASRSRDDLDQVRDAGLLGRSDDLVSAVRDGTRELAPDHVRRVEDVERALLRSGRRGHALLRRPEVLDARGDFRDPVLGQYEGLPEASIESFGDVPREFEVLLLVLTNRHLVRLVGEDVRGLEDRVEQQTSPDERLLFLGLLLELRHPGQLAICSDRGQQPTELGVLSHVRLAEEDATGWIEPGGQQDRSRVVEALAEFGGVEPDRDGVEVDDAVDRLAHILERDVGADRPQVVAEVLATGRLDAGEHAHRAQRNRRDSRCDRRFSHARGPSMRATA
jgi:hypothetical protein